MSIITQRVPHNAMVSVEQAQNKYFNTRIVSVAPTELIIFVSPVYPGFHFGLCPHSTLGFAGVPCLKALVISLNFDALSLCCRECVYLQLRIALNILLLLLDVIFL